MDRGPAPVVHEAQRLVAAGAGLARVMAGATSAVLLVDLDVGDVLYANALARQLAPEVVLPASASIWSIQAGLRDEQGAELESTRTPLARVASGQPVNGEVVTASRASDVAGARERLWVVGIPLRDAPAPLGRQALVAFLPLRDTDLHDGPGSGLGDLRHDAVLASHTSFTISDPQRPDNPLMWVNPAFERATGYAADEVVGRNCRFLQGPLTDRAAVARIRAGLLADEVVDETLLNYRADGTAFWNHVVISPVFDRDGVLTHHVGVQTDVTERIDADAARDAALARAEAATGRQRMITAVSSQLSAQLSVPAEFLRRAPEIVAANVPGITVVVNFTERDVLQVSAAYGDPTGSSPDAVRDAVADAVRELFLRDGRRLREAAGDPSTAWPVVVDLAVSGAHGHDAVSPWPAVLAPLRVRDTTFGFLVVVRPGEPAADADSLAALADIALYMGMAMDNARLYAGERETALILQRSLLPTLPVLDDFDVAAAYIPAANAEVGGDWFDVLQLPGPWIGVAVGDVVGHDMVAAAVMGQLRSMVRTLAWEGHRPATLVHELSQLMRNFGPRSMATLLYAMIDKPAAPGDPCRLVYTSAGHLPALLRHADGRVDRLDVVHSVPVGIEPVRAVSETGVDMPSGSLLVLYTDGLVERRDLDIDDRIDALADVLVGLDPTAGAEVVLSAITEAAVDPHHADDTCVLVLRRTT